MYIVLIPSYIVWHYSKGYQDLCVVLANIGKVIVRIFSLGLLFKTLFDPFERLGESYERGKISMWFEALTVNLLMRIVGIIVRLSVILIGLFALVLWCCFSIVMIAVWAVVPLVIVGLLYIAAFNLVKAL